MFSKALFKQSCKANGVMWAIITFAVCFMLACVMLISGSGNIGETKNAIQDTIVKKEVEASFENRAISYYVFSADSLKKFDEMYAENATETISYLTWLGNMPTRTETDTDQTYAAKMQAWNSLKPGHRQVRICRKRIRKSSGKLAGGNAHARRLRRRSRGLCGGNAGMAGKKPRNGKQRGGNRL